MNNKTVLTKARESQEALNTIDKMKRAALRRDMPSRWYRLASGFIGGVLFILFGLKISPIYLVPLLLLFIFTLVYYLLLSGILYRMFHPSKMFIFKSFVGGIVLVLLLSVLTPEPNSSAYSQYVKFSNTYFYSSIVAIGVLVVTRGLISFAVELYTYLSKINKEKNK